MIRHLCRSRGRRSAPRTSDPKSCDNPNCCNSVTWSGICWKNKGFRPNRQQMSILCALRSCAIPRFNILISFWRFAFASGATNRVGGDEKMTITKTIATTIAAVALLTTSALAADIVRKAPVKKVEEPKPLCDLAFGGGLQSDYNFRGISQSDRGPGRLRLCGAALQSASEHRALRRHLGLERQVAHQSGRRSRPLRRHPPDDRPGRVRFRLHVLLVSARDAAVLRRCRADHADHRPRPSSARSRLPTPTSGSSTARRPGR